MVTRLLFFVGLMTSCLYIWSSGVPQISHLLIISSSLFYLIEKGKLVFHTGVSFLILFGVYAFFVNSAYWFIYEIDQFLISSVQIFFNIVIYIFVFSFLSEHKKNANYALLAIFVSFAIQWIVYLLGMGNKTFFPRYSGTFNDPNQMAYWVLAISVCFFLLVENYKFRVIVKWGVLGSLIFLITISMSRSALVAAIVLVFSFLMHEMKRSIGVKSTVVLILFTAFMLSVAPIVSLKLASMEGDSINIASRLIEANLRNQADERGYTRFSEFPEYLLLGSGQGYHERFNQSKEMGFISAEMHTSWGGVLHYYGIVGASLLFVFLYKIFRKSDIYYSVLVFSTFIYGLSTYSIRTPVFWVLLAVFSYKAYDYKYRRMY